ncbi:MAG: hypothetical protein R3F38_00495 [Gammaproteobacteria bacterium]
MSGSRAWLDADQMAQQILGQDSFTLVHSLRAKQDACRLFNMAVAQLYARGVDIQLEAVRQRLRAPASGGLPYVFDRKRYWLGDNDNGMIGAGGGNMGQVTDGSDADDAFAHE